MSPRSRAAGAVIALTLAAAAIVAWLMDSPVAGVLVVALLSALLATYLAASFSRPVADLTRAVRRFEATGHWDAPPEPAGELGLLARTLDRTISAERERSHDLQREVRIRAEAEAALEKEAAQLRMLSAVVNSSLDGIITLTLDGVVTSWNPGAERLYGYTASDIVGRDVRLLIPDDRREELDAVLDRARAGEPTRDLATLRLTREGRELEVSLTMSPVLSETGAVVGCSAVARDASEQKLLEERFRLAVEASPNGMVMVDESGAIVMVNRETERLMGYSRQELLGESIEVLVPVGLREGHPRLREQFREEPQRRGMGAGRDLFGRRKDGTEVPVEIGLNPIRTADGLFVLASIVDISERLQAQHELERSNAELEQFAYVASHDLQEPLRMVASYTELLRERYEGQLDERANKYIHYAVDGARRMQLLINDLLRFSRLNTSANPFTPTDVGQTLEHLVRTTLAHAIRDAGAIVEVGEMPTVLADDVQLSQVFQNLVANGLKFRAPDRPPVVRVGSRRVGSEWHFSVADNGIGIEDEYRERVFEMFQRLHPVGRYPGSGIGLTLARKIVDRHGGRIWLDSVPGEGTIFYFSIPVEPA